MQTNCRSSTNPHSTSKHSLIVCVHNNRVERDRCEIRHIVDTSAGGKTQLQHHSNFECKKCAPPFGYAL
uniref:Uncharacterized protein n=1 Tax=Anopheles atroparvus TaxID=41427 RepID=A0AAG5DJG3_ANOAO